MNINELQQTGGGEGRRSQVGLRELLEVTSSKNLDTQFSQRIEEAERYKNEGNLLVQQGKFKEAITVYSKAINCDAKNAIYYSNR